MKFKSIAVIDLETTGFSYSKITEISIVACETEHCNFTNSLPRVLHKLSVCVNPMTKIHPQCVDITGLDNYELGNVATFDANLVDMLRKFFQRIPGPVCLVAHNGNKFDFPILMRSIRKIDEVLMDDLYCADSLIAFRQICKKVKRPESNVQSQVVPELSDTSEDSLCLEALELAEKSILTMQQINERTPKGKTTVIPKAPKKNKNSRPLVDSKARRKLEMSSEISEDEAENRDVHGNGSDTPLLPISTHINVRGDPKSFKLQDIYEHLCGYQLINAHRAENDAIALLECIIKVSEAFFRWMEDNAIPISTIQ